MRKVGVPEDDPVLKHPPKFQSSGSAPSSSAAVPFGPDSASEAPLVVNATLKACLANPEASLADPEALLEAATAQMEIDCNAEAATP